MLELVANQNSGSDTKASGIMYHSSLFIAVAVVFQVTLKMIPRIDYSRSRGLAKSAEVNKTNYFHSCVLTS